MCLNRSQAYLKRMVNEIANIGKLLVDRALALPVIGAFVKNVNVLFSAHSWSIYGVQVVMEELEEEHAHCPYVYLLLNVNLSLGMCTLLYDCYPSCSGAI